MKNQNKSSRLKNIVIALLILLLTLPIVSLAVNVFNIKAPSKAPTQTEQEQEQDQEDEETQKMYRHTIDCVLRFTDKEGIERTAWGFATLENSSQIEIENCAAIKTYVETIMFSSENFAFVITAYFDGAKDVYRATFLTGGFAPIDLVDGDNIALDDVVIEL